MKTKNLLLVGAILLTFTACKKDKEIIAPIPPTEVQYRSVDSMKLNSQFINFNDSATYYEVNNKQYIINSDTANMGFSTYESTNKFSIQLTAQINSSLETQLYIVFDNKSTNNISGTYSLSSNGICIQWLQYLEKTSSGSTFTRTVTCEKIIDGTITVQYDAVTNTISGKIEKLKYLFSEYLPLYVNGYNIPVSLAGWLRSGGSSRNQTITFKYVKQE
jgi:hypothetical protein